MRILIADDHGAMRAAIRTVLECHPGLQVCGEAKDGLEAVEKTRELTPDVVILDMIMPGLNGLRAAREIARQFPSLPILMFTNYFSAALESEAKKNGVRQVINKVGPGDQLISAVVALLNEGPRDTASASNEAKSDVESANARTGAQLTKLTKAIHNLE